MKLHLKKLFAISLIFGIFSITPIYGASSPDQIEYQGITLNKNGQGTRIIFFMKVYEGSLYLETESSNANEITSLDSPMAIRLDITSTMITSEAMKKALTEGLKKSTGNNTGPITEEINQLSSSFDSGVTSGDFYEFIYLPDIGTHVLKNSELKKLIPGLEFKKAFVGIFLSDNPIQKNLKKAMLGG